MTVINLSKAENLYLGQISWRYYNKIKKKAMEQEFSVSGLLVSMSIAFFIVTASAFSLNLAHKSIKNTQMLGSRDNIYQLENINSENVENYLQVDIIGSERLKKTQYINIA